MNSLKIIVLGALAVAIGIWLAPYLPEVLAHVTRMARYTYNWCAGLHDRTVPRLAIVGVLATIGGIKLLWNELA